MKENDGRGARRQLQRKLLYIVGAFAILLVVLNLLGVGGTRKALRDTPLTQTQQQYERIRSASQESAAEHRDVLTNQFAEQSEAKLLESVLSGHLHLADLRVVDEELMRAPSNSYAGVYGEFCR